MKLEFSESQRRQELNRFQAVSQNFLNQNQIANIEIENANVGRYLNLILGQNDLKNIEIRSSILQIVFNRFNTILTLNMYELPKSNVWMFFHVTELNLKNSNINNLQILQTVSWSSLKRLQVPSKVTVYKSLNKCKFPQLKSIDMTQSKTNDHNVLQRLDSLFISEIRLPINKGNVLGNYLIYLKVESLNKRQLYLNYLRKIPNKRKCVQQQYIEFQMDDLYVQDMLI